MFACQNGEWCGIFFFFVIKRLGTTEPVWPLTEVNYGRKFWIWRAALARLFQNKHRYILMSHLYLNKTKEFISCKKKKEYRRKDDWLCSHYLAICWKLETPYFLSPGQWYLLMCSYFIYLIENATIFILIRRHNRIALVNICSKKKKGVSCRWNDALRQSVKMAARRTSVTGHLSERLRLSSCLNPTHNWDHAFTVAAEHDPAVLQLNLWRPAQSCTVTSSWLQLAASAVFQTHETPEGFKHLLSAQ